MRKINKSSYPYLLALCGLSAIVVYMSDDFLRDSYGSDSSFGTYQLSEEQKFVARRLNVEERVSTMDDHMVYDTLPYTSYLMILDVTYLIHFIFFYDSLNTRLWKSSSRLHGRYAERTT